MVRTDRPQLGTVATGPPEAPERRFSIWSSLVGLTWSELARRLGTNPLTLRRWRQGARPNALHLLALLEVAASLDLVHLLLLPSVQPRNGESP